MALASSLQAVVSPAELAALLPATRAELRAWAKRQRQQLDYHPPGWVPAPTFPYQDLPPTTRLRCELVGWANLTAYLPLFEADPSPFVDARFKHRASLESYGASLLTELRCSWKRGACDWLLRRQADDRPIGVLHLYELSREVIGGYVPHCCMGYALAESARRQGYGTEALAHLLTQAAALFGRTEARALSDPANEASEALLRKCGFALLEDRPAGRYSTASRLWGRGLAEAG